jgi:hypothetical protein
LLAALATKKSKSSVAHDSLKVTTQTPLTALPSDDDTIQNKENEKGESDCIFNDDYKGLTFDWLAEVGKRDFVWRKDLHQALIAAGHDTIYVSKGGCEHFVFLVELRLGEDHHTIADSTFWISTALSLASEFGLEHY